jgi:hypothetical protein
VLHVSFSKRGIKFSYSQTNVRAEVKKAQIQRKGLPEAQIIVPNGTTRKAQKLRKGMPPRVKKI